MPDKIETPGPPLLADDILDGAQEISAFIQKLTPRQVYHYQEHLGLKHLGGKLIGSKKEITKRLTGGVA
jgi:hypothetical protein